jgi:hypothetical protein
MHENLSDGGNALQYGIFDFISNGVTLPHSQVSVDRHDQIDNARQLFWTTFPICLAYWITECAGMLS